MKFADCRCCERPVVVNIDGCVHQLTPGQARRLHNFLTEAVTRRHTFIETVGEHRPDGTYAVRRRRAQSTGHSKVFESFDRLRELYRSLPPRFTATDLDGTTVSGSRRHLLVHHFVEHPSFGCELVAKQPLTAQKHAD